MRSTRGTPASGATDVSFASPERLRPVVYIAQGSHASYFEPRTHPLLTGPLLIGIDHPRADGPAGEYPIAAFGRWARWPGHWGSSERAIFGEGKGPPSPGNRAGNGPTRRAGTGSSESNGSATSLDS